VITLLRRPSVSTLLVVSVWVVLVGGVVVWAAGVGSPAAYAFCVAAPLLWMTGMRALALWLRAGLLPATAEPGDGSAPALRVALLFCVADDADVRSVEQSARQDVGVDVVVLDDSRDPAVTARLAAAAAAHGWTVIRRSERRGFKAGNLNHGLGVMRGRYDAYALCDSDVVLPSDFVRRTSLSLADPTVAVVQAQPVARRGDTWFARYFGPLLDSHLSVTRRGREAAGVVAFLGRGALIRAAALDDVGGVPETVAEDLALTVSLRRRGWRLVNTDVEFSEDYPIDYRSFRTQMRKTAEGAVEFLRGHVRRERRRGLPGREACDLLLETALLPVTAVAGVVALVSGAALAAGGYPPPVGVAVASALAALAPLLPEAVRRGRARGVAAGAVFLVVAGALYASTMFVVLSAVLRTLAGRRAVFRITPKRAARPAQLLGMLQPELVLVPAVAGLAVLVSGAPVSALAPVGALALALAFTVPGLRVTHRVAAGVPVTVASVVASDRTPAVAGAPA
jgi:heme exporter protein D